MELLADIANVLSIFATALAGYDCSCIYIELRFYEKNNTVMKQIIRSRNISGLVLILMTAIAVIIELLAKQTYPITIFAIVISLIEINCRVVNAKYKRAKR